MRWGVNAFFFSGVGVFGYFMGWFRCRILVRYEWNEMAT